MRFIPIALVLLTLSFVDADETKTRPKPERWDDAIAKFLEADQAELPSKGGILFIGSSSIRGWDTKKWFPKLDTLNRGFGGSWIQDSIHYAEKIIFPYAPRTIVFYAGDNDVSGGLKADAVVADYEKFVKTVRERLPKTEIIFVAIKPSLKRWELWPEMKKANDQIAKRCQETPLETFGDIAPLLLGEDGKPEGKYFVKDGLHLTQEGYRVWSDYLSTLLVRQ